MTYTDLLGLVEKRVVELSYLSNPLGYVPTNLASDDVPAVWPYQ